MSKKYINGRYDLLKTNEQNGKSPGYPLRSESKFDTVTSSHARASVSFALGIADSNKIHGNGIHRQLSWGMDPLWRDQFRKLYESCCCSTLQACNSNQ